MQDFFNFMNQGWVGSLIGTVGIILGVVGIFSYRISKSIAKPSFQKSSLRLIGRDEDSLPDEVEVTYKGRKVERLTRTTLILWNNGTEVLDGNSIVENDPLRFEFSEGENILSYKILRRNNDANRLKIERCEGRAAQLSLDFDYLNPKDGAVIEILHDSINRYPSIKGSIKGVPSGFLDLGKVYQAPAMKRKGLPGFVFNNPKLVLIVGVVFGFLMMLFGLLPEELRNTIGNFPFETENNEPILGQSFFYIGFGLLYAVLPALVLWLRRKRYPKELELNETES
jgi:hypothetical protein